MKPTYQRGEHGISRIVLACVPPQVKFVVDLILDLFRFPLKFKLALKVTSLDKHKDIGYSLV